MITETNFPAHADQTGPSGHTGLGSHRYLELFKRLTPLIGGEDQEAICIDACSMIAELLEVEACSLFLANARRTGLQLAAATHIPREEWPSICLPLDLEGICSNAFNQGLPLLIKGAGQFKKQFKRNSDARYKTPSFAVVPFSVQGRVAGVVNVANPVGRRIFRQRDVDLLEAAANLIASALATAIQHCETRQIHKNLEEIFDGLHVGILSINCQGEVTHSNQRARTLLGLGGQDKICPDLATLLPGVSYNVCQRLIRQSRTESELVQDRVSVQLLGRPVMLEITISRMQCLCGEQCDSLIIFEDVGQDEEVKRLRESESMKRSFLSIISHELRTPLAVIRGALPLIDPGQGARSGGTRCARFTG